MTQHTLLGIEPGQTLPSLSGCWSHHHNLTLPQVHLTMVSEVLSSVSDQPVILLL